MIQESTRDLFLGQAKNAGIFSAKTSASEDMDWLCAFQAVIPIRPFSEICGLGCSWMITSRKSVRFLVKICRLAQPQSSLSRSLHVMPSHI